MMLWQLMIQQVYVQIFLMGQVFMMKLKVRKQIRIISIQKFFYLGTAGAPTTTDVILSSDNLDEKLDSAIEGVRNKE